MSGEQQDDVTLGIEHYVFVLLRQWRLIAATTVLGAILAAGYLILAPQTVTATTTINLNVITTEPFSAQKAASGLLDDATETAIAKSHVVASRAAEILKSEVTASDIRAASTVSTASGAAIVTVEYEADTAAAATSGADAVASAYLAFRTEQAEQRIAVMVSSLTERIDALNVTLGEVNQALAGAEPSSVAYAQATTQRSQILTELDGLLSERNGLQSVDTTGGTVLSSAKDNKLAYAPGRTLTLLTGIAAGLVLGVIGAFVRNPFDRRLRNSKEVARSLGGPVFASIDAAGEDVPAVGDAADALRVARERMLVDVYLGGTVLVVDATHAADPASTAINLAVVTAQAGHDVQLIVPEASEQFEERLDLALELGDEFEGVRTSLVAPTLSTFTAHDDGDERQGDLLLTRATLAAIDGADEESLTFLVLSSSAHPASILSALRVSQSVVVVCREFATTSTELGWITTEARGLDTPVLGAVLEKGSARRKREADAGVAWPLAGSDKSGATESV